MRKLVGLALVAAAVAVTGTVGLARPRAAAPVQSREYPAITAAEAREDIDGLEADRADAVLKNLLHDLRHRPERRAQGAQGDREVTWRRHSRHGEDPARPRKPPSRRIRPRISRFRHFHAA